MADPSHPNRRALLAGTAAGVVASLAPAASHAAVSADAELLALCAEWQANNAEYMRLSEIDFASEEQALNYGLKPWQRESIDFSRIVAAGHALLEEINGTAARTASGRRAKAGIIVARLAPGGAEDAPQTYQHDECLAYSIALDILASPEDAA